MNDLSERTLSILPARNRAKLETLLIDRDAAYAAYRAASDREQEARQEHALTQGRARERMEMPPGIEVHPAVALIQPTPAQERAREATETRLMEPVHAAKHRLELAITARERAAQRMDEYAYLWDVIGWLERVASLGGVRLEHCPVEAKKTRNPAADISRLRAELEALDAEWSEAENAPALSADLKAHALEEIEAIAAKGAPSVSMRSRGRSPVDLAGKLQIGTVKGATGNVSIFGDGGASFFVWLLRDEIAAKIAAMIDASSQDGAMTDDQREAAFARINARRLEIERIEEALIVAAEAEGRSIPRRRNADPRAILEVAEV